MNPVYTLNESEGRLVIHDDVEIVTAEMLNKSLRRLVTEIVLGKDVKIVEGDAFRGWKLLTKVHFNDSLDYIGVAAFMGCSLLKEVKFGTNLPKNMSLSSEFGNFLIQFFAFLHKRE